MDTYTHTHTHTQVKETNAFDCVHPTEGGMHAGSFERYVSSNIMGQDGENHLLQPASSLLGEEDEKLRKKMAYFNRLGRLAVRQAPLLNRSDQTTAAATQRSHGVKILAHDVASLHKETGAYKDISLEAQKHKESNRFHNDVAQVTARVERRRQAADRYHSYADAERARKAEVALASDEARARRARGHQDFAAASNAEHSRADAKAVRVCGCVGVWGCGMFASCAFFRTFR